MDTSIKFSQSLQNKRVIIFGGSSGLGLATAKMAAAEGANVVIISGNRSRIDNALNELPADAAGITVDLSKEENIKQFFTNAGKFDHMVYCAGENLTLHTIDETDIDEARAFFNVRY